MITIWGIRLRYYLWFQSSGVDKVDWWTTNCINYNVLVSHCCKLGSLKECIWQQAQDFILFQSKVENKASMPDTERANWAEICPYYPDPPSKELTHSHSPNRHQSIFKDRSLITKSSPESNLKYCPLTLSLAMKFQCELWRVYSTCRTYHWDQIKQFLLNITAVPSGEWGDDGENKQRTWGSNTSCFISTHWKTNPQIDTVQ